MVSSIRITGVRGEEKDTGMYGGWSLTPDRRTGHGGAGTGTLRLFLVIAAIVLSAGPAGAAPPAPVANFSAEVAEGPAPLEVQFIDESTGSPTGWIWYFGDEVYTPWTLVNASPGWWDRARHTSVALPDNSIVLMGGYDNNEGWKNDTWRSADSGGTWERMNASSGWPERDGHSSVVLPDGSIVLTGGYGSGTYYNDTWRSADNGATWTRVNASSGWLVRTGHCSVALPDGSIVLMGGSNLGYLRNDTWRSADHGATWALANASSGWPVRESFNCVALADGSIVLTGGDGTGTYYNDTWRSADNGETWARVNPGAGWSARYGHSTVALPHGGIVLSGGGTGSGDLHNDSWLSMDNGASWMLLNSGPGWTARAGHSAVALPDGTIVLTGGIDSTRYQDDTWRFPTPGSTLRHPEHTYAEPGIYTVLLQVRNAGGANLTRKVSCITVWVPGVLPGRVGIFRNSTHLFYEDYNGNRIWDGAVTDRRYTFGMSGDIPITGDWNGDDISGIGIFRNATHQFYLDYNENGVWDGALVDRTYNFGISSDIPVTGDWNGDRVTGIGIFRNATHQFYLDYNENGVWDGALVDKVYNFGISGDIPVTGDWDGDGRTEIGIFRNATHLFYLDYNGNGAWNGALTDRSFTFGISGDRPVTGNWNGDLITDVGIFRNSSHLFYLDYSGNRVWDGAIADRTANFGIAGDTPVSGSWS